MIKVVNQKDENLDVNVIYKISRPSVLGNIWKIGVDGSRDEVIEKYRRTLWQCIEDREAGVMEGLETILKLEKEYDKIGLACYCKPLRCHGDIILNCITWMKANKF